MAKKKKVRKVNKVIGRQASKKKYYFTKETQDAIKLFCESESEQERSRIYEKEIQPALLKLTENLIYIYGFHHCGEPVEHLQQACVVSLYEKLSKFDHTRGSNAFSYFNVVAKHWLIFNSRKIKKRNSRSISMENTEAFSSRDLAAIASYQREEDPVELNIKRENLSQIRPLCEEILSELKKKNDILCMNAVITILDNLSQIEFYTKRGLFVYIREITGLNSKQLSSSMVNIRKKYKKKVGFGKKYEVIF